MAIKGKDVLSKGLLGAVVDEYGPLAAISPLGAVLKNRRDKRKKKKEEDQDLVLADAAEKDRLERMISEPTNMRQGGKTRVKRIDGIAIRGKTKGRII